jgi:hypothetical protein
VYDAVRAGGGLAATTCGLVAAHGVIAAERISKAERKGLKAAQDKARRIKPITGTLKVHDMRFEEDCVRLSHFNNLAVQGGEQEIQRERLESHFPASSVEPVDCDW